ncbi:ZIP family zinc transporter [Sphingomonas jejuensis]|uniref:ZIP family zinc transporter n=1 Tax=Sphingomonas jejuensis TaxID=904715 RepID=A0ABX0XKX4_9SPHN|nr:ZIP family metal transporter [Sphingomonas jejuensis]NJC33380.1 ZIP family zinc transporter [Sphingomonas jejuensis]
MVTGWAVPVLFGIAASLATLLGGVLALSLSARMTALLAVAAGIVLGVAFLDLLPEALEHGRGLYDARTILAFAAGGMAAYLLLARVLAGLERFGSLRAHLAPASLTLHSLMDGLAMGLAFQIAPGIGWMVAVGVLTHDIADGLNTVSLALEATRRRTALRWLALNGAAPLTGVLIGLAVSLPDAALAPAMALFAGMFVYIGAVELVPRCLARDERLRTPVQVLCGMGLMLAVTMLGD